MGLEKGREESRLGRDGAEERRKGGKRADWVEMELGKEKGREESRLGRDGAGERRKGGNRADWVVMGLEKGREES